MITLFVINGGFRSSDGFVALPCDAMKIPSDYQSYQYFILSAGIVTSDVEMTNQFLVITCEDTTTTNNNHWSGHFSTHSILGRNFLAIIKLENRQTNLNSCRADSFGYYNS